MSHFSRVWTSARAIVSVLLALTLSLTGCGSSDSQGQKVEQTELPANLSPDIRQAAEKAQRLGMIFMTGHDDIVRKAKEGRHSESVMEVPGSPSSPWGFAEVENKLAVVDSVGFSTVGRAEFAAAAAALPRESDVTTLLGVATVRAQSTEMETVGAAPGERT